MREADTLGLMGPPRDADRLRETVADSDTDGEIGPARDALADRLRVTEAVREADTLGLMGPPRDADRLREAVADRDTDGEIGPARVTERLRVPVGEAVCERERDRLRLCEADNVAEGVCVYTLGRSAASNNRASHSAHIRAPGGRANRRIASLSHVCPHVVYHSLDVHNWCTTGGV